MRKLLLANLILLIACATADAQLLRMDVTYTNGQILSGPLSADLTELPDSVNAFFLLNDRGAETYGTADVVQSSIVFGDASWNASDLVQFSATLVDSNALVVSALTYEYAAQDSPTVNGRVVRNFPLDIEGTDIASGQAFHYRYDTSSQTVSVVPEPASCALLLLATAVSLAKPLRRIHRNKSERANDVRNDCYYL